MVERKPGPLADQPFTHETVPIVIKAKARAIDQWTADADGVVGPLQESPARTDEPEQTVALIPAGAARLRITSFPTVSTAPEAKVWTPAPAQVAQITASYREWPFFPGAVINGIEPASSHDLSIPRFIWWSHRGTSEWIQFRFPRPVTVSAVAPYWFIDHAEGRNFPHPVPYHAENDVMAPQSWTVQYDDGKGWKAVEATGDFGTSPDQYNRVSFKPVTASSLRIVAQLAKDGSAGLYAVKIYNGDTPLVPGVTRDAVKFSRASATAESGTALP